MQQGNGGNLARPTAVCAQRYLLLAALVATPCLSGVTAFGQPISPFGPSTTYKTDSQGYRWDIARYGTIGNGTDNCFGGAAALTVNNNSFSSPQSSSMTPDGEFVLTRSMSGLEVTRRVKVDVKAACVRYVEMFRNPSPAPIAAKVMLRTQMGRGPGQALITDTGMPAGTRLGEKDSGVILVGQSSRQPMSVVFYLAGSRSNVKPTIRNESNYQFTFTYTFNVEAGKTVSIVHGMAQRRLAAIPQAKAAAKLFEPFTDRAWTRDLPRDVRRAIVNLGGSTFAGWGHGEPLVSLEALGIERQTSDVLAIGEQTRLHGTASCKAFAMETRYGTLKVPLEKIAAIAGQRRTGRQPRVFLIDGQTFSGPIAVEGLTFTLNSGLQLEVAAENLDRLVMRTNPEDGQPAAGVVAMLETTEGDCLALLKAEDQRVAAATPWGDRQIGLDEIERMVATEERVGYQLALRDGSRLFAFLAGSAFSLTTLHFGTQPFTPVQIRRMTSAHLQASEQYAAGDIAAPHILLVGENVLVGQVDLAAIHFVTSGQKIPIPPNQIRLMRNVTGQVEADAAGGPAFEAELWDGGAVTGELMELVLPVRSADRLAKVPVHDIIEIHVPTPNVTDTMRSKIAQLIRDLGHPEYAQRKAAKETLAELGHLPKLQLDETLRTTSDPEIRRSVETLLGEIRE